MPLKRIGLIAVMLAAFLAAGLPQAAAGNWQAVRDSVMSLRERGQGAKAYAQANSYRASGGDKFDQQFVSGWLALRELGRADLALQHFKVMAMASQDLRKHARPAGKAKAGYWLGRTLKQLGRRADAETMYKTSMAYSNTFYGQLSASELGKSVTRSNVQHLAGEYPVRKIYWHDKRVRPEFVYAVIREESRFKQNATSNKAARGMMQVLDGTAKHVGKDAGVQIDVSMMRANADYNIAVGSRYLADQLDRYKGNTMLAAAAYNAGPGRADEWLARFGDPRGGKVDPVDWAESIPFKETRDYVQKVISSYVTYLALGNG